jgi:hypothetical protein
MLFTYLYYLSLSQNLSLLISLGAMDNGFLRRTVVLMVSV